MDRARAALLLFPPVSRVTDVNCHLVVLRLLHVEGRYALDLSMQIVLAALSYKKLFCWCLEEGDASFATLGGSRRAPRVWSELYE